MDRRARVIRKVATSLPRASPSPRWWSRLEAAPILFAAVVSTALFVGWTAFLGGPSHSDLGESLYTTIALAHGQFGCAFASAHTSVQVVSAGSPSIAPLFPILMGATEALLGVGHGVAFPVAAHDSAHCAASMNAAYLWARRTGTVSSTLRLSYLAWLPLMAGVVSVLRASARPRWGTAVAVPMVVAIEPLVAACLGVVFHPEYLLAAGFSLCAVSAARRDRWGWSGALVALACLSQQSAILIAVVLFVVAPRPSRSKLIVHAVLTVLLVALPLAILTSGRAIRAVIYGSSTVTLSNSPAHLKGGSLVWEIHVRGTLLFLVARVLPIAGTAAVSWWAKSRLGDRLLELSSLMSLVAVAFASRLLFEVNLFGYYFMALSVALIVLDGVRGQVRVRLAVWILFVTLAFNVIPPVFETRWEPWSAHAFDLVAICTALLLVVTILLDAVRRRIRWDVVVTLALALVVFRTQIFLGNPSFTTLPDWLWQILLVPTGIALAMSQMTGTAPREMTPAVRGVRDH